MNNRRRKLKRNKQAPIGLTINSDEIEKNILAKAGQHANAISRVVVAGMKILFSPGTHDQLFGSLNKNSPISEQIGAAAVHIMLIMYQDSKGTMPGQAMIPAGTILLAKVVEYLNRTKMFPVNDDTYIEAVKIFVVGLKHEVQKLEAQSRPGADQTALAQPPAQPQQPPQSMLQQPQVNPNG